MFDTICLSGGGINAFSFIGVLTYLEKNNVINPDIINNWIGTSAGAILSFFFSIGYTFTEIKIFILEFNFQKLEPDISIDFIFNNNGVDNGDKIMLCIANFLKVKYDIDDITFIDLYKLTKKKLSIIGTNFTKSCDTIFNYETYPNMSVLTALRITISIPLYFTPVLFENEYYVDGGLTNNFPINYCNKETTLGIYVKSTYKTMINDFRTIIHGCFSIYHNNVSNKYINDDYNIIMICEENDNPLRFDLSHEDKLSLINKGAETVKNFLSKESFKNVSCKSIQTECHAETQTEFIHAESIESNIIIKLEIKID